MKMNIKKIGLLLGLGALAICQSCTDLEPEIYSKVDADSFNQDPNMYESKLGDVYVNLQREYGYVYREGFWSMQENTTDECFVPTRYAGDWKDDGAFWKLRKHEFTSKLRELSQNGQNGNNAWQFLSRGIAKCNDMLAWMDGVGASEFSDKDYAELYILRAWYHYLMMDTFGNIPFMTKVGDAAPVQLTRAAVCDSIMTDLLEYVPVASTEKIYSRVNKYVGYMTLAKMYLNAEAWGVVGKSKAFPDAKTCYQKAAEYADKVITEGGYSLSTDYFDNFKVNNDAANSENIWCVFYDKNYSKGMQFHMMSLHYASKESYGLKNEPWNGYCTSHKVIALYGEGDKRIDSWARGQQKTKAGDDIYVAVPLDSATYMNMPSTVHLPDNYPASIDEILNSPTKTVSVEMPAYFTDELTTFENTEDTKIYNIFQGARFVKFRVEEGVGDHMSNDFPIFRLADAYLMKAEALMRANGGNATQAAVDAANMVRSRAGATAYTTSTLTLDEMSNERVRELCWEGFRRQDMIRFGRFTGPKSIAQDGDPANLWVFRNEVSPAYKNIFPLPDFIISNYGYPQNDGYTE
jgi:hypothetical protein